MSAISPNDLILDEFKKNLVAVIETSVLDRTTGEWIKTPEDVNFVGAILPVTLRDLNQLQILEGGQISVDIKKLYTEYPSTFKNETVIKDGDIKYQIYTIKDYGIASNLRRYYIKRLEPVNGGGS
jgi:hypothetical protein